jgi:hypothetical protein
MKPALEITGIVVGVLVVITAATFIPSLIRYMRMSKM